MESMLGSSFLHIQSQMLAGEFEMHSTQIIFDTNLYFQTENFVLNFFFYFNILYVNRM